MTDQRDRPATLEVSRDELIKAVADELVSYFTLSEGRRVLRAEAELIGADVFRRVRERVPEK